MQVQTPFYVIKRTVVTKETALALWRELWGNDDPVHNNAAGLIDFCLSGQKEEKVFLSLGDRVRLKENAVWVHDFPTSGESVFREVRLGGTSGGIRLNFESDNDYEYALYPDNLDLSDYVELI